MTLGRFTVPSPGQVVERGWFASSRQLAEKSGKHSRTETIPNPL
jgi:hypothetical protein